MLITHEETGRRQAIVAIILDVEDRDDLKRYAKGRRSNMSAVVRDALIKTSVLPFKREGKKEDYVQQVR